MPRKLQSLKVYYLLNNLSLGELQGHAAVQRLVKQGRKPPSGLGEQSIDRRPIVKRTKRVIATGIPASTLKKFRDRILTPRRTSYIKLVKFYERLQYQRLRAAGMNYKDGRKFKSYPPDKINKFISHYRKNAQKIQRNYEIKYKQQVKAFVKQEQDKLKPPKSSKKLKPVPLPSPAAAYVPEAEPSAEFDRMIPPEGEAEAPLISEYKGGERETYLDEDEEEIREVSYEVPQEIKEPLLDDYPSIDEVIFGMSESDHRESDWDNLADTSGIAK